MAPDDDTLRDAFPSCPLCLSTTHEVTTIQGRVLRRGYRIRCTRCRALWRIDESLRGIRITLVEEGSNPRNLNLSDVIGQEQGSDYWRHKRKPVFRCRRCGTQGHVTTVPFRIGGAAGAELIFTNIPPLIMVRPYDQA